MAEINLEENQIIKTVDYPYKEAKVRVKKGKNHCHHSVNLNEVSEIKSQQFKKQQKMRKRQADQFFIRSLNIRDFELEKIRNTNYKQEKLQISRKFANGVARVKDNMISTEKMYMREEEMILTKEVKELQHMYKQKYQVEPRILFELQSDQARNRPEQQKYLFNLRKHKNFLQQKLSRFLQPQFDQKQYTKFSTAMSSSNQTALIAKINTEGEEAKSVQDESETFPSKVNLKDDGLVKIASTNNVIHFQYRKIYGDDHVNREEVKNYIQNPQKVEQDKRLAQSIADYEKILNLKQENKRNNKRKGSHQLAQLFRSKSQSPGSKQNSLENSISPIKMGSQPKINKIKTENASKLFNTNSDRSLDQILIQENESALESIKNSKQQSPLKQLKRKSDHCMSQSLLTQGSPLKKIQEVAEDSNQKKQNNNNNNQKSQKMIEQWRKSSMPDLKKKQKKKEKIPNSIILEKEEGINDLMRNLKMLQIHFQKDTIRNLHNFSYDMQSEQYEASKEDVEGLIQQYLLQYKIKNDKAQMEYLSGANNKNTSEEDDTYKNSDFNRSAIKVEKNKKKQYDDEDDDEIEENNKVTMKLTYSDADLYSPEFYRYLAKFRDAKKKIITHNEQDILQKALKQLEELQEKNMHFAEAITYTTQISQLRPQLFKGKSKIKDLSSLPEINRHQNYSRYQQSENSSYISEFGASPYRQIANSQINMHSPSVSSSKVSLMPLFGQSPIKPYPVANDLLKSNNDNVQQIQQSQQQYKDSQQMQDKSGQNIVLPRLNQSKSQSQLICSGILQANENQQSSTNLLQKSQLNYERYQDAQRQLKMQEMQEEDKYVDHFIESESEVQWKKKKKKKQTVLSQQAQEYKQFKIRNGLESHITMLPDYHLKENSEMFQIINKIGDDCDKFCRQAKQIKNRAKKAKIKTGKKYSKMERQIMEFN